MSSTTGHIVFAAALGLLLHFIIGNQAFPHGDDFAYAPLAAYHLNPDLFPRDDQLRMFANHAALYEWVYRLGVEGPGVGAVFRVAVILLSVAVCVGLTLLLTGLSAPVALLPVIMGFGVVVLVDGMGRADYGGLISSFFHHHNAALALILFALAAAVFRKSWLAGAILGLAVFAQPMTAFHGAIIAGLAALLRHPSDAFKMALAAMVVSAPAALPLAGSILQAPSTEITLDLVKDAYRFRAPAHYDPSWQSVGLTSLYLLAGVLGTALMWAKRPEEARFGAGMMLGFLLLHLVTIGVYKEQFAQWVGFFILDANRSSALLYALGPAFAVVGIMQNWRTPGAVATASILLLLLLLNGQPAGITLIVLGAAMAWFGQNPRTVSVALIAVAVWLAVIFPGRTFPVLVPEPTRVALERIRAETPPDALFVIPVGLFEFRHYAQRSAYVDFKLFSVAQPEQAALTRARIAQVAEPTPENRGKIGWQAASSWDVDQSRAATCAVMKQTLQTVEADYYLRRVIAGSETPACSDLPRSVETSTLVLYGPLE